MEEHRATDRWAAVLNRPAASILLLIIPTVAAGGMLLVGSPLSVPELLLAAVAALALLLRRHWPLAVLAVATLAFVVLLSLLPTAVAAYAVAASDRVRPGWLRWTPAALLVIIPAGFAWHSSRPGAETVDPALLVANVAIVVLLCAVVPIAVGLLVRTRRDQAAAIAELRRSRDREARLVADVARAEERAALAREMHDVVSDKISLISVRSWTMIAQAPSEAIRTEAETIRSLSKITLEELRQVMRVLREPGEPGSEGLAALPELVAGSGLDVTLRLSPELREESWSAAARRTAYRTVQEALTNIRKHAPGARAQVEVAERNGQLTIKISNEPAAAGPRPADLPSGGHGLLGLRERAALIGAKFRAEATETGGFVVEVRIPATAGIQG
ncbi:sensor histidine kinase [Microlunatus sp. GCM10028923]|uniref:sensor histidine kinase n=1 Tax=Microlunatus sp. GCM10028923 TaxID=3273400 RepID=UPI00360CE939